jgi:hypothetical protein
MTPDVAVDCLAKFIVARDDFTYDEISMAMARAGMPGDVVYRAFNFTQVAWGQWLNNEKGFRNSSAYVCFDVNGSVVESGRLVDEAYFVAASKLISRYADNKGFLKFAMSSSFAREADSLLESGLDPIHLKNLQPSPAVLFLDTPTAEGIKNANNWLDNYIETAPQKSKE